MVGHAHTIEMNVPDGIMIEGDQDRLRQLFTNIIGKCVEALPRWHERARRGV